ncbi:hypothetical protein GE09DRAFT_1210248 [Coniochaeta sp. 2T2.1]|nr:hypothetical protein GE09DRAFT_1210248 [Coniochaeta sp. 2T2.1]
MPTVVYSLDNAFDSFFSEAGASSSRMQCDDVVRRRYGGQIRPVSIQGSSSYTVITGPSGYKIIQFREQAALLDLNLLALAKEVHGDVVPGCLELGWVGEPEGSQLAIYEMDRLPGENYIIARPSLTRGKRLNTVRSLASGEITGVVDWPGASIQPFGSALYALENALGSMTSAGWKWFDNADDLRDTFWRAFREQTGLSEPQTRLIKLEGKAGILIRYGTAYDSGFPGMIGVRDSNAEGDFRYLDALLF